MILASVQTALGVGGIAGSLIVSIGGRLVVAPGKKVVSIKIG